MPGDSWSELKSIIADKIVERNLTDEYIRRINVEIHEIEKQVAYGYWIELYESKQKFDTNKHGLVIPWLLGMTDIDPIRSDIPHKFEYQTDYPDIDIDILPEVRDNLKLYVTDKYGHDKVCQVGTWTTYKFKLALQDVARALGKDPNEIVAITRDIDDEMFSKLELKDILEKYPKFAEWADANEKIVESALRIRGLIKTRGVHAGGLIISSEPIESHIPLIFDKNTDQWVSAWPEGQDPWLSKFGFVKFDFLGLKNVEYIYHCVSKIKTSGVEIVWDINPDDDRMGWEVIGETRRKILLNDPEVIKMFNEVHTESVFQFDTSFMMQILRKGGVKNFDDIVVYNALGRPGPKDLIPSYVARRDGKEDWQNTTHPKVREFLGDTYGIIVYQEQLAKFFMEVCGFTAPEAEFGRKAVAKKWEHVLKHLEPKIINGAIKSLGEQEAHEWWDKIKKFARYCFNRSHGLAYAILSYRNMWLKTHYPVEWWATVLTNCDSYKLDGFIRAIALEGIKFGKFNCDDLPLEFGVVDGKLIPGLITIKGVGVETAGKIAKKKYSGIDEFVETNGRNKNLMERLIKLGAFDNLHINRNALWHWYQYKYGTDDKSKATKLKLRKIYAWPMEEVHARRVQFAKLFKQDHPTSNKIPPKIAKWHPNVIWKGTLIKEDVPAECYKDIELTYADIEKVVPDLTVAELAEIEYEYLGYYLHSPMEQFKCCGNDIEKAKINGMLECIVEKTELKTSKAGNKYGQLTVIDGVQKAKVNIWNSDVVNFEALQQLLQQDKIVGVKMRVDWSDEYRTFSISRGTFVELLERPNAQS